MNLHLSHEQLCDLLSADLSSQAAREPAEKSGVLHEHLRACPICSAELRNLRDSLTLFRDASVSYTRRHFVHSHLRRSSIAPPQSYLTQPLYWAAAVLVLVAALFPLSMRHPQPASPVHAQPPSRSPFAELQSQPQAQIQSDAALLADIDRTLSGDVPASMEALADPTADASTSLTSAQRKN